MAKLNLRTIAWWLVLIGAVNWGLVGAFDFNLVGTLLGTMAKWVYILVGASALYLLFVKK